ncbi:peptidase M23 [Cohnella pontilimi]|uniref:Peptidase M23 n=1 Tax=Cohnella pontilimi TaxID=2564100 RepID=A0A4V5LS91_9BACL|nr:M23 family metallopeptidase [Cohnella pontilimi]TJY42179.1 peptidase M23 [Cohnella pontilimi]
MKWKRQKFTFMVIPDANSSRIVKFQLSAIVLTIALVTTAALTSAALIVLFVYNAHAGEVGRLKHELANASGKYEKIISEKERHIGDLQTEVASLSDQAKSIQNKMADLSKLETQLKQIAGLPSSNKSTVKAKPEDSGQTNDYAMDGAGGEELPVPQEAMDSLVVETRSDFSSLDRLIQELTPRLLQTKEAVLKRQKELSVTPTIWPTVSRRVTSLFGVRTDPFTHRARYHAGIDISGDVGDPVYAAADGTVTDTGKQDARGNYVEISHGNGLRTRYMHLHKILTSPGTKVKKGDLIAELGNTGRSTGPHLHYEVSVDGGNVDPKPYLQSTRKE